MAKDFYIVSNFDGTEAIICNTFQKAERELAIRQGGFDLWMIEKVKIVNSPEWHAFDVRQREGAYWSVIHRESNGAHTQEIPDEAYFRAEPQDDEYDDIHTLVQFSTKEGYHEFLSWIREAWYFNTKIRLRGDHFLMFQVDNFVSNDGELSITFVGKEYKYHGRIVKD